MDYYGALLGKLYSDGVELELAGGLDFLSPLQARPNSVTGRIEIVTAGINSVLLTKATLASSSLSASTGTVSVLGRDVTGDGGEGTFRWNSSDLSAMVTADPQEGVYVPPVTDPTGVSGAWVRQWSGAVSVGWFGAKPTATAAVNTTAIQAAISFVAALGGGEVRLPAGTFTTTGLSVASSDVALVGSGVGVTTIELANGADAMVLSLVGCTNWRISDLTIDGNSANQTLAVHGIRAASVDGLVIERVEVADCKHYGIGFQDGTIRNVHVRNVHVHDTGGDGIDFKNRDDDNDALFLSDILIERFGLANNDQAGIDIRGPAELSGIVVREFSGTGTCGVRFRNGELLDSNGYGGHRSHLRNFDIRASASDSTVGVIAVARDVVISGGYVSGTFRGVNADAARCSVASVVAEGCSDAGFATTIGVDGTDATFTSCVALGGAARGWRVRSPRCTLNGCRALNNVTIGVDITSDAPNATVVNTVFDGNGSTISNAGASTRIADCQGHAPSVTTLVIATGVITIKHTIDGRSNYAVDTEGSAAADDLDTVNGGTLGDILILRCNNASRVVTVKDGTGNLQLTADCVLDATQDRLMLLCDGSSWVELTRANNS